LLAGVDDGPFCSNNVAIYGSAVGDGNTPVCTRADIGPGTYVAVIKARFGKPGSLSCSSDPRYVVTLDCTCASAFTYQGQLKQDGLPFEGLITADFTLFNAQGGGRQIGPTLRHFDVPVTNGLFTVSLDFGRDAFDGNPRWLEIVTRDGALPVVLSPRQLLTSTPYATHSCTAQTAETAQAVDWSGIANIPADVTHPHSLDASDGTPVEAVFVDTEGKVGIGTTSPAYRLHVKSAGQLSAFMAETTTNDYARIAVKTRDNEFFLQAENAVGNWFGVFQNGGTTPGWKWIIEKNTGEVGIGTTAPAAKLDVRGDVRLGASGDLFAPGGIENLRVVRGRVAGTGATSGGAGFESFRLDIGKYQIRFNPVFAEIPTFTATAIDVSEPRIITIVAESTTAMEIQVWQKDGSKNDSGFHFMAMGPR
jgi:hypothetical protein